MTAAMRDASLACSESCAKASKVCSGEPTGPAVDAVGVARAAGSDGAASETPLACTEGCIATVGSLASIVGAHVMKESMVESDGKTE